LGFPLATRGQMFWLADGHPNALAPGKRPRTTLSPTIVTRDRAPYLAFGSPGGDYQDQWTLHFFLGHVHSGLDIQEAIEQPEWQSIHVPDSFYPRGYTPAGVMMEERMPAEVVRELERRGHRITPTRAWFDGRHVAAQIDTRTGIRRAASNPRRRSSFAAGR
ncbi:MAG: gamma-glutamyltransferase family protein, partial [Alphaproteobacteria bacterium]|nr:gamma-glutamyltransferase family protein [Alphaproteobacteria bacterium]